MATDLRRAPADMLPGWESGSRTLTVQDRVEVADGVVALTLSDAGARLPAWTAGSHVDLHLPGGIVRQYSLCGDPADDRSWRLAVLWVPDGRGGSAAAHRLAVGDRVVVSAPRNHFALDDTASYLFVAGGIGITPILPMLVRATSAGARWQLHYGGRTRSSMAFAGELLARYGDAVHLYPQDETGLLDLREILETADSETLVYACGPGPLLATLGAAGLPAGTLRLERFSADPPPDASAGEMSSGSFDVVLARTGATVRVPEGGTILESLRAAGIDAPSSCEEGICGSCVTTVLEGRPDHRDLILTDEERANGDEMMICVSLAHTPTLTLDL